MIRTKFRALFLFSLIAAGFPVMTWSSAVGQTASPASDAARMKWWADARFGMFIHWGIYSVPAKGEWYMTNGHVPIRKYEKYASEFNPTEFDADQWVKIAKNAGMKYLVITSKHHDGFSMFRTKATKYNVVDDTPWGRDPLKSLSDACRKNGIRFCVYYSIMDWHNPDQEAYRPDSVSPTYNPTHFKPGRKEAYIDFMKTQLKELVTQYHPGVLWFDGGWMDGWTGRDGKEIYDYLRTLDPKLIINNRVVGAGDYETPEQEIPPNGLPGHYWETCMTINDNWGYDASDHNFKPTFELIRNLVDIASKGGNYLLNVGPTDQGVIPQPEVDRLNGIGRWLKANGEAIYGTTAGPFSTPLPWGRCTAGQGKLYLDVFDWPTDGKLVIHGLYTIPRLAYVLTDPRETPLNVVRAGDSLTISVPLNAPDAICSVVALDFTGEPVVYNPPGIGSDNSMFIDTLEVGIQPGAGDAIARYTLDGSAPTAESPAAAGRIVLEKSTVVSVRYFIGQEPVSEVSKATFTKVEPDSAVKLTMAQAGIGYKYYEGSWQTLPDFGSLSPLREGTLSNFVLPPQKSEENYGVAYDGYIEIPKDGVYTFFISSDDGSSLSVDGKLVVNNDGLHGMLEKSGTIALAAGYHPIRVTYFQAGGADGLSASFKEAHSVKESIPDSLLFH